MDDLCLVYVLLKFDSCSLRQIQWYFLLSQKLYRVPGWVWHQENSEVLA